MAVHPKTRVGWLQCCDRMRNFVRNHKKANEGIESADGVWNVNGCCHGGCYVLTDVRYCPFCGANLPKEAP